MISRSLRFFAVLAASIFSAAGSAGAQGSDKPPVKFDILGARVLRDSIGTANKPERTVAESYHQSPQVEGATQLRRSCGIIETA